MLLHTVVAAMAASRATASKKAKVAAISACLREADADEAAVVATWLSGRLPQRRTGVGWAGLSRLPDPAEAPSLEVAEVHEAFDELGAVAGSGSVAQRAGLVASLFGRATADEQQLLRGLVSGEVRSGVREGLLVEAVAAAYERPLAAVRRAVMLSGTPGAVAGVLAAGGEVDDVSLVVGRPAQPMLAASAPDVAAAVEQVGLPCLVDAKLDGIRVQVHRRSDQISVWSRSLDDLTGRFPELEADVLALDCDEVVLDGEALLVGTDERPLAFQDTASRAMTRGTSEAVMRPYFFDVLHLDGRPLLDASLAERAEIMAALVPEPMRVRRLRAETADEAAAWFDQVLAEGQEGVVVKALDAPWAAGRRGAGWVKVKPRHTLDLVVLAVEWGSGRRRGWLSNIHLGARNDDGGYTMLGKTFKGMTDEMLAWQTERFTALADGPTDGYVVTVRPEQVVEIAFDGVQRSTRYPGGVALRFARVLRYRDDKRAEEADTLATVQALGR